MKPRHFALCLSLLSAAALPAQTMIASDASRPSPTGRPSGPLLSTLDTDRDGTLSPEELRLAPIVLSSFDLDEDGFLLHDEIRPASMGHARRLSTRLAHTSARRPTETAVMIALDANHDGVLQPLEVANATSSLRRLDLNGDGAVTGDELRANAGTAGRLAQR